MSDTNSNPSGRVAGYCPMGCGQTLFVGEGGYITCSHVECPSPSAVHLVLGDRETEHIVELYDKTFSMKHPLRERVGDELLTCALGQYIKGLDGPPRSPGRYRVVSSLRGWAWQALDIQVADDAKRETP